jgi:hypothetical protein
MHALVFGLWKLPAGQVGGGGGGGGTAVPPGGVTHWPVTRFRICGSGQVGSGGVGGGDGHRS